MVLDILLLAIILNKNLEPIGQITIATDELADFVNQNVFVNEILGEHVAKLEKLVHGRLVANVLLDPIEKGEFFLGRTRVGRWRKWLRYNGSQGGRDSLSIIWLVVELGSL